MREWYGLSIGINYRPTEAVAAWLASVSASERDRIEKEVAETRAAEESAENDAIRAPLIDGIRDLLSTVADRADKDGTHWGRLAEKFTRVVKILPAFNRDNDPAITAILKEIQSKLIVIKTDAALLGDKENPKRAQLVSDAKAIAQAFDSL